ncbi:MAG: hypothetical protein QG656_133, partial [Candidatus Hydrogenedentes bacterium]|nr:hypothetical protein [Candidatus Hydrogenedentota bacterium]
MRLRYRIVFENAVCLLVLAVLAVLGCGFFVLFDRIPLETGGILFEPPWEQARPADCPPLNAAAELQARQFYPWYTFLSDTARNRDSALWNSLEGCGLPFMALWRTRCYSPFSLPFYFALSFGVAIAFSVFLKMVVAGICAFYAARKFGFAPPMALAVAVAFEFSGPVFLWMGWPMSDVVPWLPLWLVYVERLVLGQAHYWSFGALIFTLMALGGDPESLVCTLLFSVLYVFLRVAFARRRPTTAAASTLAFVASMAVGVGLAAIQLVPYWEFLSQAASTGASK